MSADLVADGRSPRILSGGRSLRILVVTDAWTPQINGVVRTLSTVTALLREAGHVVEVVGPDRFRTVPCPTYPEIRLAVLPKRKLARIVDAFRPDAVHVATEGPLGLAMRSLARRRAWRFTTSFHTRFAEYVQARTRLPLWIGYAWLARFHNAGAGVMVATASLGEDLRRRGLRTILPWSRGVDTMLFRPDPADPYEGLARPVFACIGRVAVEKNIAAFLSLDLPGTKVVVGDGPQREALQARFPDAVFTGMRTGRALSASFAGADVFVFPSVTDTFGLVILESLAAGTPVAAYPVTGPADILSGEAVGVVRSDLREAALDALTIDRSLCRPFAERHSWHACAQAFLGHLAPVSGPASFQPAPARIEPPIRLADAAD